MRATCIVAWLGVLAGSPVAAQPGNEQETEAFRAFTRGSELFKQRQYVKAIVTFERAYRLRPHFMVQCSIARCHQNLNEMVEAAEHYQRCLDEGGKDANIAVRVQASLRAVKEQITWVEVQSPGRGGTVYVDGRVHGAAPRKVGVNPGTHVFEVRRHGARPATSKIKTLGGEERELVLVPLDLKPVVQPAASAAATTPADAPEAHRRGLSPVWFWTVAGAGVALAVATTVMGVQTLNARSDYNQNPTEEGVATFDRRRLLTNVFFGLTAATAAGGTLLFFYTDFNRRKEPGRQLSLGFGLRGTF